MNNCKGGNCETAIQTANEASYSGVEDPLVPLTFVPPPFAGVPSITIEFCDRVSPKQMPFEHFSLLRLVSVVCIYEWLVLAFCSVFQACRLHRATWTQTELFLTFPPPTLTSISLIPQNSQETSGRFRVWLSYIPQKSGSQPTQAEDESQGLSSKKQGDSEAKERTQDKSTTTSQDAVTVTELLWDRKTNGGFPELKDLVCLA
jgi:predicted Rdx family selenoprotein